VEKSTFFMEKSAHQMGAFLLEHARNNLGFGMNDMDCKSAVASHLITRSIHNARDLCPIGSSGTHHTSTNRHRQSTVMQIFAPDKLDGSRESLHLCMGGDVMQALSQIVPLTNDLSFTDNHCTDRHFVLFKCFLRQLQRFFHIHFIRWWYYGFLFKVVNLHALNMYVVFL